MLIRYLSHHLRTPLNTIFLGLQILRGEITDRNTTEVKQLAITYIVEDINKSGDSKLI